MADVERTIKIVFGGDDQVSKALASVGAGFDKLEGAAKSVSAPLADVANKVLAVETALAALAIGGIALAVRESGKFGDSFGEVSTLIHASSGDVNAFREDILAYAQDSTASIEDINSAVYTAISAGTEYSASLDLLSTSEKLAVAGRAELDATTKLLASTLNAYGESTDQAQRYADVFFTTVEKGQTTIPELANSLAQVTGVAAQTNVPIETLTAAIAALTATGMPTTQAITGIKGILTALIKPTKDAQETAKALGIEFGVGALKAKGLEGVLQEVYTTTGGNVTQIGKLFGNVEGLNSALVLGADASGQFVGALDATRNATGAVEAAYLKMEQTFSNVNQNIANNIKVTLIKVGDELSDKYAEIGTAISNIFQGISTGVDQGSFAPLFALMDSVVEQISDTLSGVGEVLPEALDGVDFSGLVQSIQSLGGSIQGAFEAVFGDIDLSTPKGVEDAIQKVVDALTGITNVTAGIVAGWKPFLEVLGEAIDKFLEMDSSTQRAAGNVLGIGQAMDKVLGIIGTLTGSAKALAIAMTTIAGTNVVGLMLKLKTAAAGAGGPMGLLATVTAKFSLLASAGAAGWVIGTKLREAYPEIDRFAQSALGADTALAGFDGTADEAAQHLEDVDNNFFKAQQTFKRAQGTIEDVQGATEDATAALIDWSEVDAVKSLVINVQEDAEVEALSDFWSGPQVVTIESVIDQPAKAAAKKEIDESFTLKKLQVEADIQIAEIEAQADIIRDAMKFTAEVNVAQIEAATAEIEATFESVNTSIMSTGTTLTNLFSQLGDASGWDRLTIQDSIRDEEDRRQQSFDLQQQLVEAQIRLAELRVEQMEAGEPLISISGDGLEPEIEAFMWKILERIQIRANQDAAEFLLGI